ncbi:MAG: efflux RND transporter permease subunit, partial [Candidatus Omnitrophica bacterium]|nr:efflux RND transporter permease subunit [Candidatus Omnitrophota bacterium]
VNIVSILGFIILGGIVVNNGIVLIDYINVLRGEGKNLYDSVVEASATRLRPILMTALTTVLGLVPLALGLGEGAELQSPLAVTVMGGLLVSTFLTLIVIPTVYLMSEEFFTRFTKKEPPII